MEHEREDRGWGAGRWLACGCGGCLLVVVLVVGFFAAVGGLAFLGLKKSDVYQEALRRARESPAVVAALGEPIEPAFLPSGSISISGPDGEAGLAIPISGPRGSGTVIVSATKRAGRWEFTVLEVEIDATGTRIDLLGPPAVQLEGAAAA